jgi:hypothetical protein
MHTIRSHVHIAVRRPPCGRTYGVRRRLLLARGFSVVNGITHFSHTARATSLVLREDDDLELILSAGMHIVALHARHTYRHACMRCRVLLDPTGKMS